MLFITNTSDLVQTVTSSVRYVPGVEGGPLLSVQNMGVPQQVQGGEGVSSQRRQDEVEVTHPTASQWQNKNKRRLQKIFFGPLQSTEAETLAVRSTRSLSA